MPNDKDTKTKTHVTLQLFSDTVFIAVMGICGVALLLLALSVVKQITITVGK